MPEPMRLDLKKPCRNCPFRTDEHAIRFRDEIRALEIALTAQRWGFPCHKSADLDEDRGGYVFDDDGHTQHCAGALIMMLKEGHVWSEGTGASREVFDRLRQRLDLDAPVFGSTAEFLAANRK